MTSGCAPREAHNRTSLVIYSAGPRPLIESVVAAFEEQTGIPVELFAATTGQIMARLEAERHRPRADVVIFASEIAAAALKNENRLIPYLPDWLDETRTEWHDPDGYYLATGAAVVGIAIRSELWNPQWEWIDFFSGEFPGRVTMPSPSRSGAAGDFVLAYTLREGESTWQTFRMARRNGLEFSAANSQAITSLLIGAYDAIVGAVDYLIYRQIESGADIRIHFPPSGGALVTRPIAIMAHTPFVERSQQFVDFYFQPLAQQQVAQSHLLPARRDVPLSELRQRDGEPVVFSINSEAALNRHAAILRRFQIEIERAAVIRDD